MLPSTSGENFAARPRALATSAPLPICSGCRCCPSICRKGFPNLVARVKIEDRLYFHESFGSGAHRFSRVGKSPQFRAARNEEGPMRAALMQLRAGRMDFVVSRCATRALVLGILFLHALPAELVAAPKAVVLQIDGAIGPAVADYVVRELRGISQVDTRLVVLRMNTPGGLDTSMRVIIRAILSSPVPVAVYVAPSGARAASAGTYITYASAIAAMAPGTNLGAATPIQLGGMPHLPGGAPEQPAGQKGKEKGSEDKTSPAAEPAGNETGQAEDDAGA